MLVLKLEGCLGIFPEEQTWGGHSGSKEIKIRENIICQDIHNNTYIQMLWYWKRRVWIARGEAPSSRCRKTKTKTQQIGYTLIWQVPFNTSNMTSVTEHLILMFISQLKLWICLKLYNPTVWKLIWILILFT